MTDDLNLGRQLGRREAFNMVAARCSAADAALLRQMRDEKLYLNHSKDWEGFCTEYLHMGKANANRIIRLLEEFGPAYFEVAQLTRISPATYRAIAPAIQDQALRHNGEAIALIPENAEKVAAAVLELRKTAAEPAPKPDPVAAIGKSCDDLVADLTAVVALHQNRERVRAVIGYLKERVDRIELTL